MKTYIFQISLVLLLTIFQFGCSKHKVDTVEEWCEQITGVDLNKKYMPFWAITLAVTYDADAIRDEFVNILDTLFLEKVNNRSPKMAWRDSTTIHIVNLSSLMMINPDSVINEWRIGIDLSNSFSHDDFASKCLYGTLTSLFDTLYIHTMDSNVFGKDWKDEITIIPTKRDSILGENRL